MRLQLTPFALLALAGTVVDAFAPASARSLSKPSSFARQPTHLFEKNENQVDTGPVEPGSHDELMYALGVNLARQLGDIRPLVESGEELAKVSQGLLDTVIGKLSDEGQRTLLATRGKELNALVQQRAEKIRDQLIETGKSMLDEMSQTEGAETLDSGVVLHVLEHGPEGPGEGTRPTKASTVKVHYHGTLCDGTAFDSTLGADPVVFPLNGVIPGWRDALLKMHEGETAMIGVPPDLAYGMDGTPDGRIPPGSTLFFKVTLYEVMSAGIGGSPKLVDSTGQKLGQGGGGGGGLVDANGNPL